MSAKFPSIRVEGGLLAPEVLDDIAEGKAPGQAPKDFNLSARHLLDEISSKWSDARDLWQTFSRRLSALPPGDSGVRLTRNQWMAPFLGELGYVLFYQERAREIDGQTFAISHFAGTDSTSPPVHIIGANQSLDLRPDSGRPRLAAHSLVQEYLNRTESLWGLVTNGRTLRLLRDSHLIRRQAFIEFDLETMFNGEHFADFAVLYRLLHRTRLPHPGAPAHSCFLEQWHQLSLQQGGRVREHLRDGVENAVYCLANAILAHPANTAIRQQVDDGRLKADQLYEEFLRFVYRLLFLMVTEERNLLSGDPVYREHYSISRLRRLVECWPAYNQHTDLWRGLFVTFRLFSAPEFASVLGCPPLNGELFEAHRTPTLESAQVANADFLAAFSHLSRYREDRRSQLRRINYSALDVEELGSVYESLLDLQPAFQLENGNWRFAFLRGTERRTTGSYYTPSALVEELIQSALVPVLNDRLRNARSAAEKEAAVLSITVCDPACGSGHFLLAAARRLARELARVRSGEDEPSPQQYRLALRDVITHCIYGVDRNPLAVELCKVALWLESHAEGKPLSFLDHRILCGDSLAGLRDLAILKNGVPDDTFKPVTGDDKDVAKEIKRRNRAALRGQRALPFAAGTELQELSGSRRSLFEIPDDTPEQVCEKRKALERWRGEGSRYQRDRTAADLWTSAFFVHLVPENLAGHSIPSTQELFDFLEGRRPDSRVLAGALSESVRLRFFHWPLEFPEVFARGGFDVILCNPPWERIKLQQEEFFATRDLDISRAPNAAARRELIEQLREKKPALWREYQEALQDADAMSKYLRTCGQFPLTGRGDINTYAVFAERFTSLLRTQGRVGAVVPSGIATDNTTRYYFSSLVDSNTLVSLYDFENRLGIFEGVDRRYRFCLMTISGAPRPKGAAADFVFFAHSTSDLADPERHFTLTAEDIALINPNTRTCPIFRTRRDAEITKAIYRRVPVLVKEGPPEENPWGIRFSTMFHMSNDSHLFRTREQLEAEGFTLRGNHFFRGEEEYVPLYEAKMMHQYNHRFGDYAMKAPGSQDTELPRIPPERLADPNYVVMPRYWVRRQDLPDLGGRQWLLGFRDITNATNERTAIFAILPPVGVGNKIPLLFTDRAVPPLVGCFASLIFDFSLRQKLGGTTMNFFYVKQLAVLTPSAYTPAQ